MILSSDGEWIVRSVHRTGKILFVLGVGLFTLAVAVGVIQSLRVERRLPAIDLFVSGSKEYINRLLAHENRSFREH